MGKHKKYDMLLAKAEDMDLIILLKYPSMRYWEKSPNAYPPNNDRVKAFLCLPEHEEACQCGLNGESVEIRPNGGEWVSVLLVKAWGASEWYMSSDFESRVKQK